MEKNIFRTLVVAFVMTCLFAMQPGAAPKIKYAQFEGNGKVEVHFTSKVKYSNVKITVKDSKGKKVKASVTEKDNNELEFVIKRWKPGKKYTYTISGIKKKKERTYSKVKGRIKLPYSKGTVPVKEAGYDEEDREVAIEFSVPVEWKDAKVTVTYEKTQYAEKILEKDREEIEIKVKKLKKGRTYHFKISGIRKKGSGVYGTVSGTFIA